MSVPTALLNDGYKMPLFGLGTSGLKGEEGEEVIKYAIVQGYRLFDTASLYGNEIEVGNAIRAKISDGIVQREDLFITTKLSSRSHKESQVVPACKESLKNLGLKYVDLFLIHSPISLEGDNGLKNMKPTNIDYVETWRGMEECKKQGLARSIGISNFNSEQISRLISTATILPVNNQVEVNLGINQKSLISFCKKLNIIVTGYTPLSNIFNMHSSNVNTERFQPIVEKLSRKYEKTTAQILLRFVYEIGAVPIPKSANKLRIKENIDIFNFSLTSEEIKELESIETGKRVVHLEWFKDSKYFPFTTAKI